MQSIHHLPKVAKQVITEEFNSYICYCVSVGNPEEMELLPHQEGDRIADDGNKLNYHLRIIF